MKDFIIPMGNSGLLQNLEFCSREIQRNRLKDIENKLMVTKGKSRGGGEIN